MSSYWLLMFNFISYAYCHLYILEKETFFPYVSWIFYCWVGRVLYLFPVQIPFWTYALLWVIYSVGYLLSFLKLNFKTYFYPSNLGKFQSQFLQFYFMLICLFSLILILSLYILLHLMISHVSLKFSSFFFITF